MTLLKLTEAFAPLFDTPEPAFVAGPVYTVSPVFGRARLLCPPEREMLAVVQVTGRRAAPVDCLPLAALGSHLTLDAACEKVRAAFTKARGELQVAYRRNAPGVLPGWQVSSSAGDLLEFVARHRGEERLNEVLRHRTREHAHQDMKLDLGPHYYSFMIRQMTPW